MSQYYPDPASAPRHVLFPGVVTRTCCTDKLMLSYVTLEPGSIVPEHHHPHEQAGLVVKGRARFNVGGEERTLGPGDWYLAPGGVPHHVVVLDEPCEILDIFTPPRETYR